MKSFKGTFEKKVKVNEDGKYLVFKNKLFDSREFINEF